MLGECIVKWRTVKGCLLDMACRSATVYHVLAGSFSSDLYFRLPRAAMRCLRFGCLGAVPPSGRQDQPSALSCMRCLMRSTLAEGIPLNSEGKPMIRMMMSLLAQGALDVSTQDQENVSLASVERTRLVDSDPHRCGSRYPVGLSALIPIFLGDPVASHRDPLYFPCGERSGFPSRGALREAVY